MKLCIPSLVLALLSVVYSAHAFTFEHTALTQCGDLEVRWSGGTPPFNLLIIPPRGTLRNLSIPLSSFVGTAGTYSTTLQFPQNYDLFLAMSDATGPTAGGITPIIKVGAPQAGASCNTADPGVDFIFSADSPLRQCADFPFTNYGQAVQPITIFGFVPGGQSFSMQAPRGDSFAWRADIPAGTTVAFSVIDASGRNGGTSPLYQVAASSDNTCIRAVSQSQSGSSSTPVPSPSSSTQPSQSQSSGGSNVRPSGGTNGNNNGNSDNQDGDGDDDSKGGPKVGVIVGAAAGGFLFLCALAFIYVFCFKRKRKVAGQPVALDSDYKPPPHLGGHSGLPSSPSNTYLLPSTVTSNTNLEPTRTAAPYAQNSYSSAQTGSSGVSGPQQEEYNPYGYADPYGGYAEQPTGYHNGASDASGYPFQGVGNNAPVAAAAAAGAGAAVGAASSYGYNSYSQYQQQQQQGYAQQAQQPQQYASDPQLYQKQLLQQQVQQQYGQYPQQGQQQYPQQGQYTQQGYTPPTSSYTTSRTQGTFYATNADSEYTSTTSQHSQYPPKPHNPRDSKSNPPPSAPPPRLIVHRDIDESMDLPDELPPQYSESRAPIPGLPNSTSGGPPLRDRKR